MAQSAEATDVEIHIARAVEELHRALELLPNAAPATGRPTEDVLKMIYQEVCKRHQSISEFRGKLLALIPFASAAFIALIASQVDWSKSGPLLIAAGLVAAVVTFGLGVYEIWQTDDCQHLIHHAGYLELRLGMESGQFRSKRPKIRLRQLFSMRELRERKRRLDELERHGRVPPDPTTPEHELRAAGPELAGLIVYVVVIVGWLTVAGFGVAAL